MWNAGKVTLASAPRHSPRQVFTFQQGALWGLLDDTYRKVVQELGDGTLRRYDFGVPLPNVGLDVRPWLTRGEMASWRLFLEYRHDVELFPNYGADTSILHHFEDSTTPELAGGSAISVVRDADATFLYESGLAGRALDVSATAGGAIYLLHDFTPAAIADLGTVAWWMKLDNTADTKGIWLVTGSSNMTASWVAGSGIRITTGSVLVEYDPTTLTAGTWGHVVVSWDRSAGDVSLWWNGLPVDSTTGATMPTFTNGFRVGSSTTSGDGLTLEEFRYDATLWDDTTALAQYERLTETEQWLLHEQMQGYHFQVERDPFQLTSTVDGCTASGAMLLSGVGCDERHIIKAR